MATTPAVLAMRNRKIITPTPSPRVASGEWARSVEITNRPYQSARIAAPQRDQAMGRKIFTLLIELFNSDNGGLRAQRRHADKIAHVVEQAAAGSGGGNGRICHQ